jgi:hypothetical protein
MWNNSKPFEWQGQSKLTRNNQNLDSNMIGPFSQFVGQHFGLQPPYIQPQSSMLQGADDESKKIRAYGNKDDERNKS